MLVMLPIEMLRHHVETRVSLQMTATSNIVVAPNVTDVASPPNIEEILDFLDEEEEQAETSDDVTQENEREINITNTDDILQVEKCLELALSSELPTMPNANNE